MQTPYNITKENQFYPDNKTINYEALQKAIQVEKDKQIKKWGSQTHTLGTWNTILSEEFGEVSEAILEYLSDKKSIKDIRDELIQVITVSANIYDFLSKEADAS
jgi:NTP pyrophosphatase (non-canonical NTP hydrolase)